MRDEIIQCDDFVLGMATAEVQFPSPSNRHDMMIRSMLLTELVAIWQRDELSLKVVLEKVDDLDMYDWESTMDWLGHFYVWDSCRHLWDLKFGK